MHLSVPHVAHPQINLKRKRKIVRNVSEAPIQQTHHRTTMSPQIVSLQRKRNRRRSEAQVLLKINGNAARVLRAQRRSRVPVLPLRSVVVGVQQRARKNDRKVGVRQARVRNAVLPLTKMRRRRKFRHLVLPLLLQRNRTPTELPKKGRNGKIVRLKT